MDENFQTYLNRAVRMTLPDTHRSQVQHIQSSPKFRRLPEGGFQAEPFPGYTIVTPTRPDDRVNRGIYDTAAQYQQELLTTLSGPLAPVPADSFHVTLADVIWDSTYRHAAKEPRFDSKLQACISDIFQKAQLEIANKPVRFQAIGLMVMTRAIALCLAPLDEDGYQRIIQLRRMFYQSHDLIRLGIEQQYYFTPHITLAYFGDLPDDRAAFAETLIDLNEQWIALPPQEFWIQRAELRKFSDMSTYTREPDWPFLEL